MQKSVKSANLIDCKMDPGNPVRKDPDAGKRLKSGEEGDDRGQDGWIASPTQ